MPHMIGVPESDSDSDSDSDSNSRDSYRPRNSSYDSYRPVEPSYYKQPRGEAHTSTSRDNYSRKRAAYNESSDSDHASSRDDPRSHGASWNRNVWDSSKQGVSVSVDGNFNLHGTVNQPNLSILIILAFGTTTNLRLHLATLTFGHLDQSDLPEQNVQDLNHLHGPVPKEIEIWITIVLIVTYCERNLQMTDQLSISNRYSTLLI